MKKYFAVLLAVLMIAGLAACGAAEKKETETKEQSAGMANPWTDTDYEGFKQMTGLDLGIPEGAKDVAFRVLGEQNLGEMNFTLDGQSYTARIKPAPAWEDISGMYYTWAETTDCEIENRTAKTFRATESGKTIDLCEWCDIVPGIMYSLTAESEGGLDLTGLAAEIFVPLQGDAG